MASKSPTARTLALYRAQGFVCEIVERWLPKVNLRRDLIHCIDVLAIRQGEPIIGIQATSRANVSARIAKARAIPELRTWLSTGARFIVIGFGRQGREWVHRIEELFVNDLAEVDVRTVARPARKRPRSRWENADLFASVPDEPSTEGTAKQ